MPLQHRRGYAADLHRGLPTGDITQSRSSQHDANAVPVRAATQPISVSLELVAFLRGFQPLVPHVRLSVSLAEPGPSDSADPPRRCRGLLPPSPASPGSGCPQLLPGRCDGPAVKVSHPHSVRERLVALDVPRPDLVRPGGDQLGLDRGRVGGLRAPLAALARLAQQPVEGGQRPEVGALIQQGGPDLGWRSVGEPLRSAARRGSRPARPGSGRAAAPGRGAAPAAAARVPGWRGAAGTSWPAPRPTPRRPPGCRSSGRAGRWPGRSRARPGLGVRALGDRLQERLQFCLDIHHEAGLGQLLLQLGLLFGQPGDLRITRISRRTAPRPRRPARAPASRARRHSIT